MGAARARLECPHVALRVRPVASPVRSDTLVLPVGGRVQVLVVQIRDPPLTDRRALLHPPLVPRVSAGTGCGQVPAPELSVRALFHVPVEGVHVGIRVRCVDLVPHPIGCLRVEQQDVVNATRLLAALFGVAMRAAPLPHDLAPEVLRPEDRVKQHLQVVTRRRIAVQIEASSRLQDAPQLREARGHHPTDRRACRSGRCTF